MDTKEFSNQYHKFLKEIRSVIRPELYPLIDELESNDPIELVAPGTKFFNEKDARGFVWNLFIDWVNKKYSYRPITIDIDDIKSVEDIEMFFILLEKEHIHYHPETSFRDITNSDLYGNTTVPTFTFEESERLDKLMGKSRDLVDELDVNIYDISKRANLIVRGKNSYNQSPMTED